MSLNKYFRRYRNIATITKGQKEPMYAPTTARNSDNAVPALRNGTYNPTSNGHLNFEYKNTKSISSYINGAVKGISMSEGSALDNLISNRDNFE